MSISNPKISLLLFQIKRKFLIYKLLTNDLKDHLINEFQVYFSSGKLENQLELSDDLIYEYFAPIVNSFQISIDLNYRFDHFLLKNFYIKFYLYKSCILLLIFSVDNFNPSKQITNVTNKIFGDFYSKWFCKSFISLVKFKFGICSDERCFQINNSEINELFIKWSELFSIYHLFFIEAIEEVQINDDIRNRFECTIKEFIEFLIQNNTIMADIEHLDKDYSKNNEEFLFGEDEKNHFKNNEVENFFSDATSINFYMIVSFGKILFTKYRQEKLPFDSSSIFVLLIESFLFLDTNANEEPEFKHYDFSFSPESINSENEHYLTVRSSLTSENSNYITSTPKSSQGETKESPVNQHQDQKVQFKKISCFLRNKNKSLGFYDVFYLKIGDSLCLISVKDRKYSWYCELISDFESLLIDFLGTLKKQKSTKKSIITNQFLTFFINKFIEFFEQLKNLKSEINPKESNKSRRRSSNLLSRLNKNLIKPNLSFDETILYQKKKTVSESKIQNFDQFRLSSLIKSLLIKLKNFNESQQFKNFRKALNSRTNSEWSENEITFLQNQVEAILMNLDDLFYEFFLSNSQISTKNINNIYQKENLAPRSAKILDCLNSIYFKNLNEFETFLDVKIKRNYTMAFYSYLMKGLVHFTLVNRNTNKCLIPTFDYNNEKIDEKKINQCYRKYLPIIYNFLQKHNSTSFFFTDESLGVNVYYKVWLIGSDNKQLEISTENKFSKKMEIDVSEQLNNSSYQASCLLEKYQEASDYHQPGMTDKNYFELLKILNYPNASSESIICNELITIHSIKTPEKDINKNTKFLMNLNIFSEEEIN